LHNASSCYGGDSDDYPSDGGNSRELIGNTRKDQAEAKKDHAARVYLG
jgi:hypothetical protein